MNLTVKAAAAFVFSFWLIAAPCIGLAQTNQATGATIDRAAASKAKAAKTRSNAPPAAVTLAEKFGALPRFSNLALSSDGTRFAYGVPGEDGNFDVVILYIPAGRSYRVNVGEFKLRGLQFEENGHLLVTVSATASFDALYELTRIIAVDPEGKKPKNLLLDGEGDLQYNVSANIESLLPDEPDTVLMSAVERVGFGATTTNLYKVNVVTGKAQLTERGGPDTVDWLVDRSGAAIARVDHDPKGKTSRIKVIDSQKQWRDILVEPEASTPAFTLLERRQNGRLLIMRDKDSEFGEIEAINPANGAITQFLRTDGVELQGVRLDPWTRQLVGVSVGGIDPQTRWIDPVLSEAQLKLETTFPGQTAYILDSSTDKSKLIAAVAAPGRPDAYYLMDIPADKVQLLGEAQPTLKYIAMGTIRSTTFKSRDGIDIPVYVTTPAGHSDAKNAAMIMMPHGGPASRDYPEFDYWAQMMAAKGYVIVQPQFRGSTGFGQKFEKAGRREWGKIMQHDVSDAVAWAVSTGLADPKKICIVGASYGGYAALAGATLTPDLYRCVVSVAGVSDLERMLVDDAQQTGGRASSSINYWREHVGADDKPAMRAVSPRRLAANVVAPVLLLHGDDDSVVLVRQSKDMRAALQDARKAVRYVALKGEDHWLSRSATRVQMLTEVDAFLSEHLGPGLISKQ